MVSKEDIPAGSLVIEYCIAAGSLVNLANGTSVPIEQVRVGESVLALRDGGLAPCQVSAVLPRGTKECVELTFSDGRTLECTEDHRIHTSEVSNQRWERACVCVCGSCMNGAWLTLYFFDPATWLLSHLVPRAGWKLVNCHPTPA